MMDGNRMSLEKLSVLKIEACWCNHRDRHMFQIMKKAINSAEHSLTNEILRKINPREAELLNDPVFKSKLRFRFAGEEFPPFIVFKVFIETNGRGVKYLCGKKSIKVTTDAAKDSCELMGNRKYFDQIITDLQEDKRYPINNELDVSNLQDYMKYLSAVDEKSAYSGGKANSWRNLTLQDIPRNHLIYDIVSFIESNIKSSLLLDDLHNKNHILPLSQTQQVECINRLTQSPIKAVHEPRRRSRQAKERVAKMKRLYKQVDDKASEDDEAIAQVEYHNNNKFTADETCYSVDVIKGEVDVEDESWDEEGKYLFEWTRQLSFERISTS